MAALDDMAERPAAALARQQVEEGGEIVLVEARRRRQLPQDRPELGAELEHAPREEPLDQGAASPSAPRYVGKRGPFSEKTKSSGVSACQLRKLAGFCAP